VGIVLTNGYQLANRARYVCVGAHFSKSASTLTSDHTGLNLNFWQRVINERQENISTRMFREYQGSGQDVNMCVCSGGTSRDWTKNKRGCFQ